MEATTAYASQKYQYPLPFNYDQLGSPWESQFNQHFKDDCMSNDRIPKYCSSNNYLDKCH